jgi:alpha-tubulin suppressor-like RCC1 family protein
MVEPIKTPVMFDINEINNRQNSESKLTKVVSGSNHSTILIAGKIFIRGEPETHTVGRRITGRHVLKSSLTFDGVGLNNVEDLWCGGYHTIAKIKKGNSFAYYGWGLNIHGQIGINNYEESPYPV